MPIGVLSNEGITFTSKPILDEKTSNDSSDLDRHFVFQGILEEKAKLIKHDRNES